MKEIDAIIAISDVAGFANFLGDISPQQLVGALSGLMELQSRGAAESGGEVISHIGGSGIFLWEASQTADCQAVIGAALVKMHRSAGQVGLPNGLCLTSRLAVAFGRIARTENECGGVRQALPLFGQSVNFVRRLNSAHGLFKKNFLVGGEVPVIWPPGVVLQKVDDITINGNEGTRTIYSVEGAAS